MICDTQTVGVTAIRMCLGTHQTDQSSLLVGSEFVDCGCGDQPSQTWKDCFHISAGIQVHAYTAETTVALMEELCEWIK